VNDQTRFLHNEQDDKMLIMKLPENSYLNKATSFKRMKSNVLNYCMKKVFEKKSANDSIVLKGTRSFGNNTYVSRFLSL